MRASQLVRGYLQHRVIELPLARPRDEADQAGSGDKPAPVMVGLRPLTPSQEADIFERARRFAEDRGLEKPAEGDELYEYGKAVHRCLLGTVDPDTDPRHPAEFFDGGLDQILGLTELGRDGVLTLAEQHAAYQDDVQGQLGKLDDAGLEAAIRELAGPRGGPFYFSLRPGLRVSCTLFMAHLLLSLLDGKSSSGSDSALAGRMRNRLHEDTAANPRTTEP